MKKIQMTTPLVDMDGNEMTRILWKWMNLLPILAVLFLFCVSCNDDQDENISDVFGTWSLESVFSPFGGTTIVNPNECTLSFKSDMICTVNNNTVRSFFLTSGDYNYILEKDRKQLVLNGITYFYSVSDKKLVISEDIAADGNTYYFIPNN